MEKKKGKKFLRDNVNSNSIEPQRQSALGKIDKKKNQVLGKPKISDDKVGFPVYLKEGKEELGPTESRSIIGWIYEKIFG